MAQWVDKDTWTRASDALGRRIGKKQAGAQGDRVKPTAYTAYYGKFPLNTPQLPNGARQPDVDVPNLYFIYAVSTTQVPFPSARNKAWNDLVDKVRTEPASLGQAFAEFGQAADMVASRCVQLHRAYRDLRRGRFRDFLRTLGLRAKRKDRNRIRSAVNKSSSLWLEYSFGWKPLVQDVYQGLHAMGQPIPSGFVKGYGSEDYVSSSNSEVFKTRGKCNMGAKVYIANPNQYLLQQLGIANPASVIWEIVPFSFLVDWVFDVGTFLGAYTDFFGCDVRDAWTSYRTKASVKCLWDSSHTMSGDVRYSRRKLGLDFPMPNASFHANIGSSLTRAANAVSLLGQILTK